MIIMGYGDIVYLGISNYGELWNFRNGDMGMISVTGIESDYFFSKVELLGEFPTSFFLLNRGSH